MANHSLDSIERLTQQVLRQAGALTLPIDLEKVAAALRVQVHEDELDGDVSGVLIVKGAEQHVLVNKAHPVNRKRFTIAHEFGHLCLHDSDGNVDGERMFIDHGIRVYQRVAEASSAIYGQEGSLTTMRQEREANMFASCLLMPSHHVTRAAMERDLFDELNVASVAKAFGVSEQAMSIRLQQLKVLEPYFEEKSLHSHE